MIDSASIKCRLMLDFFPEKLQERLLQSQEIFDLGEFGLGESGSGLTLNFHQIAKVLSRLQMHEEFVLAAGSASVALKRTPDGVLIGSAPGGEFSRLVEAGLMDPDVGIRERSLSEIMKNSWPLLLDGETWQATIRARALTPFEIGKILGAKSAGPIRFFARLQASNEFDLSELAPASPDYYRMLLPQPPLGKTFDGEMLARHLDGAVKKNLSWGWWLVRASFADNSLSPPAILAAIPDELFIKHANQSPAKTPYGKLAEISVALARSSNAEMAGIVKSRVDAIVEGVASVDSDGSADLVAAFLRLTFARVIYLFPTADVVWRRMVSLTHANLLAEALFDQPELATTVHRYCESQQLEDVLSDVWDMRGGAAWQMGFEVGSDLWVKSKARMEELILSSVSNGVRVSSDVIPDNENPDLLGSRSLILDLVSPIEQPCTQKSRSAVQMLSASQAGLEQFSTPWEEKNWNTLWLLAMAAILGDDICVAIETELDRAGDDSIDGRGIRFLVVTARIAAAQQNEKIADAVGRTCVKWAEGITKPQECGWLFQAIVISGCALVDDWAGWIAPRLLQLANAVPRGPCSESLAWSLNALQQLVPTAERNLNQAIAVARSAS